MPVITSRTLFTAIGDIDPNDLSFTEVNNFNTNVDQRLRDHFRWKGKAIGIIGLTLSPGNDKVASGMLVTRGETSHKELRIPCSTIWENSSPELSLIVNFPSLDIFRFAHLVINNLRYQ
jgi:hypothetical protein